MDLRAGVMVTPNVELVELVGQGGMGSVWTANHLTLQTRVAVKFISSEHAQLNDKDLARFQREATLAARMRSPHAVHIYDHGLVDDAIPYIVMELLEGETLSERLQRGALSLRETAIIVSQAAEALGRAHDQGVVHRDVKPGNLFLIDSGYELFVKVLDFGVAKEMYLSGPGEVTTAGALVGTPSYMSPEQIVGASVTPHVDNWALAVCAYRALTLALPFDAETVGGLAIKLAAGEFVAASKLRADLPPDVDAFFERAFAPNIRERIADVREMARALGTLAGLDQAVMIARPPARRSIITDGEKDSSPDAVAPTVTPERTHTRDLDLTPPGSDAGTLRSEHIETTEAPSTLSVAGRPSRPSPFWLLAVAGVLAVVAVTWLDRDPPPVTPTGASSPPITVSTSALPIPTATVTASASAAPEPSASQAPRTAEPHASRPKAPPVAQPTAQPTAQPSATRGGCTRFDPAAGKKVYYPVCPE